MRKVLFFAALIIGLSVWDSVAGELQRHQADRQAEFPHGMVSDIDVKDGFVYVTNAWSRGNNLLLFDLREPSHAKYMGGIPAIGYPFCMLQKDGVGYLPGSFSIAVFDMMRDGKGFGFARNVLFDFSLKSATVKKAAFAGERLLVAGKNGLRIMDVSIPREPVMISYKPEFLDISKLSASAELVAWTEEKSPKEIRFAKLKEDNSLEAVPATLALEANISDIAFLGITLLVHVNQKELRAYDLSNPASPSLLWTLPDVRKAKLKAPQSCLLMGNGKLALLDASDLSSPKILKEVEFAKGLNILCCDIEKDLLCVIEKSQSKMMAFNLADNKLEKTTEVPLMHSEGFVLADDKIVYAISPLGKTNLLIGIGASARETGDNVEMVFNFSTKKSGNYFNVVPAGALARVDKYLFAAGSLINVEDPRTPVFLKEITDAPVSVKIDAKKIAYMAQISQLAIEDFSKLPETAALSVYKPEKAKILDVELADGFAFVLNDKKIEVLDVKDPAQLKTLASLESFNALKILKCGNYLYVPSQWGGDKSLCIVDVSKPETPVLAKEIKGFLKNGCVDMLAHGGKIYYSDGDEIRAMDITTPLEPRITDAYFGNDEGAGSYTSISLRNGLLYGKKYNRIDVWTLR